MMARFAKIVNGAILEMFFSVLNTFFHAISNIIQCLKNKTWKKIPDIIFLCMIRPEDKKKIKNDKQLIIN